MCIIRDTYASDAHPQGEIAALACWGCKGHLLGVGWGGGVPYYVWICEWFHNHRWWCCNTLLPLVSCADGPEVCWHKQSNSAVGPLPELEPAHHGGVLQTLVHLFNASVTGTSCSQVYRKWARLWHIKVCSVLRVCVLLLLKWICKMCGLRVYIREAVISILCNIHFKSLVFMGVVLPSQSLLA